MGLLGQAAIAMWWNIDPGDRSEFHDWHSKEHLPERLAVPGFRRGSRWESVDGSGDCFVLYELTDYETLTSPAYRERLNNPTPWSTRMMPRHLNMVRSQCRVVWSAGAGIAGFMTTLGFSPQTGHEAELSTGLQAVLHRQLAERGVTSAHILHTETPNAAETTEQKIRGGDAAADWVVLVSGYDSDVLRGVYETALSSDALTAMGAERPRTTPPLRLIHAMNSEDV